MYIVDDRTSWQTYLNYTTHLLFDKNTDFIEDFARKLHNPSKV